MFGDAEFGLMDGEDDGLVLVRGEAGENDDDGAGRFGSPGLGKEGGREEEVSELMNIYSTDKTHPSSLPPSLSSFFLLPVVGSSMKIMEGAVTSSLPRLVLFFSPPEIPRRNSVPTRESAHASKPNSLMTAETRACILAARLLLSALSLSLSLLFEEEKEEEEEEEADAKGKEKDEDEDDENDAGNRNSAENCNVSRTVKVPSKQSSCSQYPVSLLKSAPGLWPFKSTTPESSVFLPASTSRRVDFPPPVGPRIAVISPARQMPLSPRRMDLRGRLCPGRGRRRREVRGSGME